MLVQKEAKTSCVVLLRYKSYHVYTSYYFYFFSNTALPPVIAKGAFIGLGCKRSEAISKHAKQF
jgi:hypothetical protein